MNVSRFKILRCFCIIIIARIILINLYRIWSSSLKRPEKFDDNRYGTANISGAWRIFNSKGNKIYFHRAIYDERVFEKWGSPCVTLYVASNTLQINELRTIYCKFSASEEVKATVIWTNEAYRYPFTGIQEYVIQCPLKIFPVPNYVFIRRDNETTAIAIEKPVKGNQFISVCVPIVYGSFETNQLIEWFEFLRYFGIKMIDIYYWKVSDNVLKVFEYYREQNIVSLKQVQFPIPVEMYEQGDKLKPSQKPYMIKAFMPLSLNECFLMSHLKSKYVLSLDLDEHIIFNSTKYANYKELIQYYERPGMVQVETTKLRYDVSCGKKIDDRHFIFEHRYRQNKSSSSILDNPKSFMSTSNCPYIGNHFCLWVNEKNQTFLPKAQLNEVHVAHYRKWETCGDELNYFELDDSLLPFKEDLEEIFNDVKTDFRNMIQ